jgi:hypothetical protein
MRDLETISLALTAAETGHLVFGTLHTSSAAKTVDRIIDVFPGDQQSQIRTMLSESLEAVVVHAGVGETRVQGVLGAAAGPDRPIPGRVVAVHAYGKVGIAVALEAPVYLDLVGDGFVSLEVEGDVALRHDGRRLDHVLGEDDALPVERHDRIFHARDRARKALALAGAAWDL